LIFHVKSLVESLPLSSYEKEFFEYVFRHFQSVMESSSQGDLNKAAKILFRAYIEKERQNGPGNDPSHFQLHLFLYIFSGNVFYLKELVKDLYLYKIETKDHDTVKEYIQKMRKLANRKDKLVIQKILAFYFSSNSVELEDEDKAWVLDTDGYGSKASILLARKANSRLFN
jgi:hypothetical protein